MSNNDENLKSRKKKSDTNPNDFFNLKSDEEGEEEDEEEIEHNQKKLKKW